MKAYACRWIDRAGSPKPEELAAFVGKPAYRRWQSLVAGIEAGYPRVFTPDWIYGGAKYGWALRYKKGKSFCTLIPEKRSVVVQIVFGRDERAGMAKSIGGLRKPTREAYRDAPVFHDGKWLLLKLDTDETLRDIFRMLEVKRKPGTAHEIA